MQYVFSIALAKNVWLSGYSNTKPQTIFLDRQNIQDPKLSKKIQNLKPQTIRLASPSKKVGTFAPGMGYLTVIALGGV